MSGGCCLTCGAHVEPEEAQCDTCKAKQVSADIVADLDEWAKRFIS